MKKIFYLAGILAIPIIFFLFDFEGADVPPASAQVHQHAAQEKAPAKPAAKPEKPEPPREAPTVEIIQEKHALIGVKTQPVSFKPLQKTIRTVGRIEYDERKLATVNAKFEGWIEKLYLNYTGTRVKKGEPLVEIYSPELYATQQEFLTLLRWQRPRKGEGIEALVAGDAERLLEAARQRLRLWDISQEQIRKIEETGQPVRTLALYSPVNGVVVQKMAVQGMRVMPGEKLFDVVDLSSVWVLADIYEMDLPLIKMGETALIRLDYYPGRAFSSKIDYIYPTLAGETRTSKIRFSLPNPQGELKPQMYTNVELKINLGKRLVIPEDSLIDTGIRKIVYVDKGEGNFEPREVSTGLRADGWVEVLKGLKAGEKVASSATFLIDSEAKLKGITPRK